MSPSKAAITYLPLAALKKQKQSSEQHQPLATTAPSPPASSLSSRLTAKLTQIRAKRVSKFFRKRAEQREVVARARANPVALITHKLHRIASLFSRSNRSALQSKLRALFSGEGVKSGVKGFLGAIRNAFKRLRGASATELLARELERLKKKQRRKAFLSHLFHALAIQGRDLLRGKRKRLRREQIKLFAPALVENELLGDREVARISRLVCAKREAERLHKAVKSIQRAWRRTRRKLLALHESKQRLLSVLTTMAGEIKQQDAAYKLREDTLKRICEQANASILFGATRRLAVRLIQRVWRGYRARLRVFQICAWRRKKEMQKLQRERLRKAREALLNPSVRELRETQALHARVQSRKEKTPLIPPPGFQSWRQPHSLTHERLTLLEPLPMQHAPPKVSRLTRAKTQRVPFATFEKICAQHARVNPQNLWVAIPVGFGATGEQPPSDKGKVRAVATKSRRKNRFFAAQYDWVPATLLQQQQPQR